MESGDKDGGGGPNGRVEGDGKVSRSWLCFQEASELKSSIQATIDGSRAREEGSVRVFSFDETFVACRCSECMM